MEARCRAGAACGAGSITGTGCSHGVSAIPFFPVDVVLGLENMDEGSFQNAFKAVCRETPHCPWFIAFGDIQPLNPDHPKAGEKRRLLIHTELIASIEINATWGSKHCLHIVKASEEYTAEFRLRL